MLCFVACQGTTERVAGWYVTRKITQYLDLTSAQKDATRQDVDRTISVIRRTELSPWVSFLREVRQGIHDGLTDDLTAHLQRRYDQRLDAGVDLLTPRLSALLAQLNDAQVDHFTAKMHEDVDRLYEDREQPKGKQQRNFEKKALKLVEDFVGDLSDEQETQVRALIRRIPDERAKQYEAAQKNLHEFRAFMGRHPDAPTIEGELRSMWAHRYDALGRGREMNVRRAEQRKWLIDVYRILDAKQRAHAEAELTDRINMLKRWVLPAT